MACFKFETHSLNCNMQAIWQLERAFYLAEHKKHITIDISGYNYITPYSMLILGATIRRWKRDKKNVEVAYSPFSKSTGYLEHLGFFDLIDEKTDKRINETPSNYTCVPLRKISRQDLRETGKFSDVDAIEHITDEISKRITDDEQSQKHFSYLIREMVRNTFEHASVDEVYLVAQNWPKKKLVEIAILDEGVGIKHSLRKKIKKYVKTEDEFKDYEYTDYALKPGVTAESNKAYVDRHSRNSGYGLYIAKEVCKKYKQGFLIASDAWSLLESSQYHRRKSFPKIDGVSIQLRLSTDNMEKFNDIRREIVEEGKKEYTKSYKKKAFVSKSSRGE